MDVFRCVQQPSQKFCEVKETVSMLITLDVRFWIRYSWNIPLISAKNTADHTGKNVHIGFVR